MWFPENNATGMKELLCTWKRGHKKRINLEDKVANTVWISSTVFCSKNSKLPWSIETKLPTCSLSDLKTCGSMLLHRSICNLPCLWLRHLRSISACRYIDWIYRFNFMRKKCDNFTAVLTHHYLTPWLMEPAQCRINKGSPIIHIMCQFSVLTPISLRCFFLIVPPIWV